MSRKKDRVFAQRLFSVKEFDKRFYIHEERFYAWIDSQSDNGRLYKVTQLPDLASMPRLNTGSRLQCIILAKLQESDEFITARQLGLSEPMFRQGISELQEQLICLERLYLIELAEGVYGYRYDPHKTPPKWREHVRGLMAIAQALLSKKEAA